MPNIGLRIRELRQQRRQTLKQVAPETGLPVFFLSMLERDKVYVSVDNLEKPASYYQVHMAQFFNNPDQRPVIVTRRADILNSMELTGRGVEEPYDRKHEADTCSTSSKAVHY